ncbi:MAG: hypothetical protein ACTHK7_11810 [Aureliella sp.]
MKIAFSSVVGCLALCFAAAPRASAQYPFYGPQSYSQVAHGQGHHDHHYRPSPMQYYSGSQYSPNVGNWPVYGAGAILSQPVAPPNPAYYSNSTYYGVPSVHHRGWHPGHYLLGHH